MRLTRYMLVGASGLGERPPNHTQYTKPIISITASIRTSGFWKGGTLLPHSPRYVGTLGMRLGTCATGGEVEAGHVIYYHVPGTMLRHKQSRGVYEVWSVYSVSQILSTYLSYRHSVLSNKIRYQGKFRSRDTWFKDVPEGRVRGAEVAVLGSEQPNIDILTPKQCSPGPP